MSTYHIVYPRGDRSKLSVVEICAGLEYELDDYAVASRETFYDRPSAYEYAISLAKVNRLTYVRDDEDPPDYLD